MEYADWNRELLLGALLNVVAGMGLISGRSPRERLLAVAVWCQGVTLLLVAGATFYPQTGLEMAAVAVIAVAGLWSVWFIDVAKWNPMRNRVPLVSLEDSGVDEVLPPSPDNGFTMTDELPEDR